MVFTESAIKERKRRVSESLGRLLKADDVLLVFSGETLQKPGGWDQCYPFIAHPDYYWISGHLRPKGVTAFSKDEGWVDFVSPVTVEERIWGHVFDEAPGQDVSGLSAWLAKKNFSRGFTLGSVRPMENLRTVSPENNGIVQEAFNDVRRIKDSEEIALIGSLAHMAAQGYEKLKSFIRPGLTEREIQIAFESEIFRAGADQVPYDTIVGTGSNASILHALPTQRVVRNGELILIDAGAARHHYCVDITRVFFADGKPDGRQKSIYQLVLESQKKAISLCTDGNEWKDVHVATAKILAEGLRALNILKVSADDAVASGVIGVFMPHGVGHMVGLHVRDVGGRPNPNPKKYAGARIRLDMPLKNGFLMTTEPGLYFIEALLNSDEIQRSYRDHINWSEVVKWMDFGGVRIEDNILVTKDGPRNLTTAIEK